MTWSYIYTAQNKLSQSIVQNTLLEDGRMNVYDILFPFFVDVRNTH